MPYISTEALIGASLVLVLAFGHLYITAGQNSSASASKKKSKSKSKKKAGKASAAGNDATPSVTASEVESDAPRGAPATKSATAKKASSKQSRPAAPPAAPPPATPSPPTEPSEPEAVSFAAAAGGSSKPAKPKTLAEKLVPKPRKTVVDDMLEAGDRPPQLARVMKIAPEHQPAAKLPQFEDDYEEGATDSGASTPARRQDDGWNVVAAKKKPVSLSIGSQGPIASNPHSKDGLTKVQRKNAKKSEVKKAQREAEEADRLRRLASHKRDLERAKINEIYNQQKKTVRQGGKVVSAGQGATLNEKGQLVWD